MCNRYKVTTTLWKYYFKSFAASVQKAKGINTEQGIKNWAEYSQAIASTMSKRMSELGLTQQMLAGKMNCIQQYISKVLKGQKNMSLETICKIENALGIEIIKHLDENEQ